MRLEMQFPPQHRRMPAYIGGTMLTLLLALLIAAPLGTDSRAIAQGMDNEAGLERLVTIDADDAFLPSVLSILAEKSGYNIVTGPGVNKEERISVHLKDVPIEQAMNLVVRAAGLSYEIVGRSFLVAPPRALKEQVGLTSYVINLKYTDAPTVKKMLEGFNANITIDTTGNKILLLTSPKIISDIQKVIEEVDKPGLQIVLECRIIEVAVDDQEQLGIDWNRLASIQTVVAEGTVDPYGNQVDQDGNPTLTGIEPSQRGRVPSFLPDFPREARRMANSKGTFS